MSAGWIDEVKRIKVPAAATALGLRVGSMGNLGPCPACNEDKRGDADRRPPIGVARDGGGWHCHRCDVKGDALDLVAWVRMRAGTGAFSKDQWASLRGECVALGFVTGEGGAGPKKDESVASMVQGMLGRRDRRRAAQAQAQRAEAGPKEEAPSSDLFVWHEGIVEECEAALWSPDGAGVLAYLRDARAFTDETIRAWRLGAYLLRDAERVVEQWLAIPYVEGEEPVNVKFRRVPGGCLRCGGSGCGGCGGTGEVPAKPKYRVCPKRPMILFGSDRLGDALDEPVIICEGELDVIAFWQFGFTRSVVSGTAGAKTFASQDDWLDKIEPYSGYVLCLDDDQTGDEGAEELAAKLGRYRCTRARLPEKDAGDCLKLGIDPDRIEAAINNARPLIPTEIVHVGSYADDVEKIISRPGDLVGVSFRLRKLDACLGGMRPGLAIVSGETGHGKTTFLTWGYGEQARHGVPTMITSFEQGMLGTVQKLLRSQLGGDFMKFSESDRRAAMAELDALPLHIVKHRGHLSPKETIEVVRYGVRRLGVKAVMLDHLGFVIDPEAEDERKAIEATVRTLSMIAEYENVRIDLVCHPSNAAAVQRRRVTLADLKGASAIRQDAHEVLIVERLRTSQKRAYPAAAVHVDKVRSEFGLPGSCAVLAFDPISTVYADTWEDTPAGRRGVMPAVPDPNPPTKGRAKREPKKKTSGEDAGITADGGEDVGSDGAP